MQRTCTISGCVKPHLARGCCSTHYNQIHQTKEQRHPKVSTPCAWCDKPCLKETGREKRYAGLFCSLECRDLWRSLLNGRNSCPIPLTHPAHPDYSAPGLPILWVRPEPKPSTRRWVAGNCHRCGKSYVAEDYMATARYCSLRCGRRVAKQRYRARKKDAYVADVSPARIYERDGWRCQLCRRKVKRDAVVPHPLAPVLDHIVPLAKGGTHEPSNAQCAHFLCNSLKSDRDDTVQLLLFG